MIKIMMVDHEVKQLLSDELAVLYKAFKGAEIEFETAHPKTPTEHMGACRHSKPTVVLLPSGFERRWIIFQAMREGIRHIVVSKGTVSEVCPLRLDYSLDLKPFEA
jgi:hypothetical protein